MVCTVDRLPGEQAEGGRTLEPTSSCCPPCPPHLLSDHEMCDLQDILDEALQLDFNIQAEDDSPYQVRGRLGVQPGAAVAALLHTTCCS